MVTSTGRPSNTMNAAVVTKMLHWINGVTCYDRIRNGTRDLHGVVPIVDNQLSLAKVGLNIEIDGK